MTDPQTLTKLIVLYMLDKFDYPLTKSKIYDFILEKEYANYFALTQATYELTEGGLIETSSTHSSTFLTLTDKGRDHITELLKEWEEIVRIYQHITKERDVR